MYKKIVSILLCICILSGFATITSAATTPSADKYEIIEIFKELDMLSDDYDALTLQWQKPVTKADFAFLASSILKRDYTGTSELYYHDVSRQHWAFADIAALVDCGLLQVNAEKRFNPNDNISMEEAAGVIIKALGYGFNFANSDKINYMSIASDIGITKGVSNTENLTYSDVLCMLYNALFAEIIEISSVSNESATYASKGRTYLEKEYSIVYKKGILEGFDGISANGTDVAEGKAVISGVEYDVEGLDLTDMLGCSIYYLDKFNSNGTGKILWAKKNISAELTLNYVDNEVEFNASKYQINYYDVEADRERKVDISKTVDVIYNEEYVTSGIEELLNEDMYSIKLIKNPGDGSYSKIILTSYENLVLEAMDVTDMGIYDKVTKEYYSFKDVEKLEVIKDGQNVELTSLNIGDVLSVYRSKSGQRVKIIVSATVAKGKIVSKKSVNGYEYISIGEEEYRGYKKGTYWTGSSSIPVTVYLDTNGYMVLAERYVAQGEVAYMIDIYNDTDNEVLIVKLFTKNGKTERINCVENVRIDDVKYKNAEAAYASMGGSSYSSSLVLYKTNYDGLITHIYFPGKKIDSALKILQEDANETYRDSGRLGRKSFLTSDTVIFGIPKNPQDASPDDFQMLQKSDFKDNTSLDFSTYTTSEDVSYEELVVIHNYVQKASGSLGLLVSKVYKGLNEDDQVVDYVEGYEGLNYMTLKCDPSCKLDNVRVGSYITYSTNKKENIVDFTVICDFEGGVKPLTRNLHASTAYSSGYVHNIVGEMVRIGDISGANFDTIYRFRSSVPVLIFNTNTKKIEIGSISKLKTYEAAGDNCSFVFTHIRNNSSVVFVVYE